MIQETELSSLLFFDLETSSEYPTFKELMERNPRKAELWKTKHDKSSPKDPEKYPVGDYEKSYTNLTPLSAEFGRIVCGSFCYLVNSSVGGNMVWQGKMKSFYDDQASETSEVDQVLKPISDLLTNIERSGKNMRLCGHNIKKFDIPWLAKRMIVSKVPIPPQLHVWGKKPWEITHLDTADLWTMGNWDGYVSLDVLSCILNIPSPKSNMHGSHVYTNFHELKKYAEIKDYCEEDVRCGAKICHSLSNSILPIVF